MPSYELSVIQPTAVVVLPEALRPRPRAFLRLHHFTRALDQYAWGQYSAFAHAMYGRECSDEEVREEVRRWYEGEVGSSDEGYELGRMRYFNDVLGTMSRDVYEREVRTQMRHGLFLSKLPGDAVLKLGLGRDLICEGCAIGDHCTNINGRLYDMEDDPDVDGNLVKAEVRPARHVLTYLRRDLAETCIEGQDWLVGIETVTLFDSNDQPVEVDSPCILMTMRTMHHVMDAALRTPMSSRDFAY